MRKDFAEAIREFRKLIHEFVLAPFEASKATIILGIIGLVGFASWYGYVSEVGFGWLFGAILLLIVILWVTLRIASKVDRT